MSKRKRAIDKAKRQNSAERKQKQQKKTYYQSYAAKEAWDEKKRRKAQSQINTRVSQGISPDCHLKSWQKPNAEDCEGCRLKCSSNFR